MNRKRTSTLDARPSRGSKNGQCLHPRVAADIAVRWPTWIVATGLLFGLMGCGTNLSEALYQTGAAAGRTFLDLWLTDVANTLADQAAQEDQPAAGDEQAADDQEGDDQEDDAGEPGDGALNGGGFDDLIGDPVAGEALYVANACGACYCADAGGGCLAATPSAIGVSAETLDERLRGDATHSLKVDLSDQEIVDLQAYLGSL